MNDGSQSGGRVLSGAHPAESSPQHRLVGGESSSQLNDRSSGSSSYDFPQQSTESQQQYMPSQSIHPSGQYTLASSAHGGSAYNMMGMAGALPDYSAKQSPQSHSRLPPSPLVTNPNYQGQQMPHFPGQMTMNSSSYPGYPTQYTTQYQQAPGQPYPQTSPPHQSQLGVQNSGQSPYNNNPYFMNAPQQVPYYSGQVGFTGQVQDGQGGQYASPYGRPSGPVYGQGIPLSYGYGSAATPHKFGSGLSTGRNHPNVSSGVIPSSPRGPPRKPKQSGHALWVGNLPSGALVGDLKDHFSRDAYKDIESVFLISKSNCAFVNYRTDAACAAAMNRFHDSRFHGVRLVCRLRRTPASPAPGVPLGPAALLASSTQCQTALESITHNREVSSKAEELTKGGTRSNGDNSTRRADAYFIMKSLTVEDMELSLRNSIWATQAHNEDALNNAYENTDNVYLIFSANKSGEYFGVARMASRIDEESAKYLDWAPKAATVVDDPDIPRSIPTPATEFAPRGRIIDDSARGTIFWEADIGEDEAEEGDVKSEDSAEEVDESQSTSGSPAFGKPFKIEWVSTNRLPFYRTRGLRNPWNANREVKIARDGTELETSVGRRLLQMFERTVSTYEPPSPTTWPAARPY